MPIATPDAQGNYPAPTGQWATPPTRNGVADIWNAKGNNWEPPPGTPGYDEVFRVPPPYTGPPATGGAIGGGGWRPIDESYRGPPLDPNAPGANATFYSTPGQMRLDPDGTWRPYDSQGRPSVPPAPTYGAAPVAPTRAAAPAAPTYSYGLPQAGAQAAPAPPAAPAANPLSAAIRRPVSSYVATPAAPSSFQASFTPDALRRRPFPAAPG